MANIGMGGQLPHNLNQTTKTKDAEKVTKKDDDIKGRDVLAGSQQATGKIKKENAVKNTERFKAFKSAYNYMLGEEPEEEEIDEDMQSSTLEEEPEEDLKNKKVKPNLKEIEKYDTRNKFKAKLSLTLGDDFNEDEPPVDEDMTPDERSKDNKIKLDIAIESYNNLIQYIQDSLGTFDMDKIEDLQLFLKYGMPDDAIIKFIMLQQLARSSYDFPNIMDMSIMLNKFKKLKIDLSVEQTQDIALSDYGTSKRLKYTIAGFIYIPIPQVMKKIEEDMKDEYEDIFHDLLDDLELPDLEDIKQKLPAEIMIPMRDMILIVSRDINELVTEKNNLFLKLKFPMVKNKEIIQNNISEIEERLYSLKKYLEDIEIKITKIIFIYSFLNTGVTISDFNKDYPLEILEDTLGLMGINTKKYEVNIFINKKVNIYALRPKKKVVREAIKKSNEIFESKVKSAVFEFSKIPPPKQQQIMKNFRNNSFDVNANLYWLKQKRLSEINSISELLNNELEKN